MIPISTNPGYEALQETPDYDRKRKRAISLSPDVNNLSAPYITDNGRTMVYFKPGADVAKKAATFEAHRNKVNRI